LTDVQTFSEELANARRSDEDHPRRVDRYGIDYLDTGPVAPM